MDYFKNAVDAIFHFIGPAKGTKAKDAEKEVTNRWELATRLVNNLKRLTTQKLVAVREIFELD